MGDYLPCLGTIDPSMLETGIDAYQKYNIPHTNTPYTSCVDTQAIERVRSRRTHGAFETTPYPNHLAYSTTYVLYATK